MSTRDEILEVFNEDIERKSKMVRDRHGEIPFYDGFWGMSVRNIWDLDLEDLELLSRLNEDE